MEFLILFISIIFFLFTSHLLGVDSAHPQHNWKSFRPKSLFVFGDSYVDTGNIRKTLADSWKFPYGVTFPGKPAGRFSDGRVATDFLARYLGIKSPIPYTWRKYAGKERLLYGMNYAHGGTGVFQTLVPLPNMTTQIDYFERVLATENIYSPTDLPSSLALVSVAGNDYGTFITKNPAKGIPDFMKQVVAQIEVNMRRIHKLGVKKIAVAALQPLGCLPSSTIQTSFEVCDGRENNLVKFHNNLLHQSVAKLNNETKPNTFVILDLYKAFVDVFTNNVTEPGVPRLKEMLRPCCAGVTSDHQCSDVDEKGVKKYTICEDPTNYFFWDTYHPSEAGWRTVYSALRKSLNVVLIRD